MMAMRKTLLATAVIAAGMASGGTAHAQLAVYDGANFANTLQATLTAAKQLMQLQSQLSQLRQTYTMFTNPTNIVGILPALNAPGLQNSMPATGSIPGQVGGTSLTSAGQPFFSMNHVFTPTGTDAQATLLTRNAISIANIQGMAQANLQSIEQRQANLTAMQTELQSATDIKQVASINGRIAIESNAIQGQQAQASNLEALANAQAQSNTQAALENTRQAHEQAAAQFTSTLN
jgi:hypothetical protein